MIEHLKPATDVSRLLSVRQILLLLIRKVRTASGKLSMQVAANMFL